MGLTQLDSVNNDAKTNDNVQEIIINELLASAWHAIETGKLVNDIAQTFSNFYDDKDVKSAYEELNAYLALCDPSSTLTRRSASKDKTEARTKDITKIVDVLHEMDWKGKTFPLLVRDISKICHVYGSLRDELQMRGEMQQLSTRIFAVETLCKTINDISAKLETVVNAVQSPGNSKSQDYSGALKHNLSNLNAQKLQKPGRPEKTTTSPPFQLVLANHPVPEKEASPQTPPSPSWKVIAPRKRKPPVLGKDNCDTLRASQVQPVKLFVSRCHTETTAEALTAHLESKWSWKVLGVENMNTKFDTYKSFKVILSKEAKEIPEYLDPDKWPQNWFVRRFFEKRVGHDERKKVFSTL